MLTALAVNDNTSFDVLLFYMIQYFFTSINIFFIIIAFGFSLPSSSLNSIYSPILLISQLKGQFYNWPLLSLCLSITLFSSAGIGMPAVLRTPIGVSKLLKLKIYITKCKKFHNAKREGE